MDRLGKEGVPLLGEHEIVGYADRDGLGEDDTVHQQRIHPSEAAHVEVDVYPAIVVQDEVADNIGALDGVGVSVERLEEPGVLLGDELARSGVCPEFVLTGRGNARGARAMRTGCRVVMGKRRTSQASSHGNARRPLAT